MTEEFLWEVVFKDGATLKQFNPDGSENSFKKIQERYNEVTCFKLISNSENFEVNLLNGCFTLNNQKIYFFEPEDKINYRLIFFKRRTTVMNSTNIFTEYWLGWQTTINGKNEKRIMRISNKRVYFTEGG